MNWQIHMKVERNKRMLGKMQVEGEKQQKYDQGFAEGLNESK